MLTKRIADTDCHFKNAVINKQKQSAINSVQQNKLKTDNSSLGQSYVVSIFFSSTQIPQSKTEKYSISFTFFKHSHKTHFSVVSQIEIVL